MTTQALSTQQSESTHEPERHRSVQAKNGLRKGGLYLGLLLIILLFIFPAFWLLTSAFKHDSEVYRWPPQWIPTKPQWQNFVDVFTGVPFLRFIINSAIVTVAGTILTVGNACLSAYAVTFIPFKFREVVFVFFLGALLLPGDLHLIPNYITTANLHWLNTYQGLVIPMSAAVLGTFLLRQNMRSIPQETIDAAKLDRAGHWTLLTRIVLPMCKPMVITVMIVTMIGEWNRFIWPLITTTTNSVRVLPIGLLYLKDEEGTQNWGTIMAGTVLTALPMIIAFIFAQRQIIQGLTRTATMRGQ